MNYKNQYNKKELLNFIQRKPDARELKRALAVKLALEEYPSHQIKTILNVSIGFISKWKKAFLSQGMKGRTLLYVQVF